MPRAVHVFLTVVCLLPLVAGAQETTFRVGDVEFERRTVSVVDGQKEAAAGEVNGDGFADVVIVGNDQGTILTGDADGAVEVQTRVPAGSRPAGPDLADLDGDGHVDIAVANHETHHLTLLQGDGSGGFQASPHSPLTISVEPHPHAVRAADLDADAQVDLIVDHRAGEGLLVLRGTGDGEFVSPGTLVEGGGDPYRGMAVGDLNGDAHFDLVTPNPDGVGVLLNTSASQLGFSKSTIGTDGGPFAVDLGDLNGDGQLDVITALDEGSSLVQVFLGDGRGAFREAEDSPFRLAAGGKMIAGGDFNGDGVDDAAIACWNASEVLLLLGGANSIDTATLPVQGNAWGPAAADLNGDMVDDLVVPDAASDRVALFVSRAE